MGPGPCRLIQRRGDLMSEAVVARMGGRSDVVQALNWPDAALSSPSFWSEDRLHMNSRGHHRVAARVLDALGETVPEGWWELPERDDTVRLARGDYFREHLGPWVKRRLTGTSSGDGRAAKFGGEWIEVAPRSTL